MPRVPRPWRRGGGPWYAQVDGEQVWLAAREATKTEAQAELNRLLASRGDRPGRRTRSLTVAQVIDLHLGQCRDEVERGERDRAAYESKEWLLVAAAASFGRTHAVALRPHRVLAWAADVKDQGKTWSVSTRSLALQNVKAAFAWARTVGHIADDPLADMATPSTQVRAAIPADEAMQRLVDASSGPLHDLLVAIRESGCRPKEVATLTADRVDHESAIWMVLNKTRRKTGARTRAVYVTAPVAAIARRLCALHPEGPIFRNTYGRPWTRNAIGKAVRRLRVRLGLGDDVIAYALRHLYATRALVNGVPIADVAELMGHRSTDMVSRVYSRLSGEQDHLRTAADKARDITNGEPPP